MSNPVILTVAPTGPIATKADHPGLPTQPEEIANAVADAHAEGATVAHLHFRDQDDRPTASLDIARRTMDLIRERCDILIQVSTGVGLDVPFEDRERLLGLNPEMATLNPCSMSFGAGEFRNPPDGVRRMAATMIERGIRPELEIYDTGHLDMCLRLRDEGLLVGLLQFSVVLGVQGGMAATPANLALIHDRLPDDAVWQVIAIGRENLRLTAIGIALGGNARAGLEDTLNLRRGERAPDSAALIRRAVAVAESVDREVADVALTRRILLPEVANAC
jgi:3-keto-5-aminohexanoate cleavage enzyme